jgi:hypothetical protein
MERTFLREPDLEGVLAAVEQPDACELGAHGRKFAAERDVLVGDPEAEVLVAVGGEAVVPDDFTRDGGEPCGEGDQDRDEASDCACGEASHRVHSEPGTGTRYDSDTGSAPLAPRPPVIRVKVRPPARGATVQASPTSRASNEEVG